MSDYVWSSQIISRSSRSSQIISRSSRSFQRFDVILLYWAATLLSLNGHTMPIFLVLIFYEIYRIPPWRSLTIIRYNYRKLSKFQIISRSSQDHLKSSRSSQIISIISRSFHSSHDHFNSRTIISTPERSSQLPDDNLKWSFEMINPEQTQ